MTFLSVPDMPLSTDCETKATNCGIASSKGSVRTSLLSLESFLLPFTLIFLSLFTFEEKCSMSRTGKVLVEN